MLLFEIINYKNILYKGVEIFWNFKNLKLKFKN